MSTTITFSIHDPEEISAMMTQASEDTQNDLTSQGDRLKNQISNTFVFDKLQSQLSLGYQFALAGNTSGSISHVEMADEALEKTIASVFRQVRRFVCMPSDIGINVFIKRPNTTPCEELVSKIDSRNL